jgi:hypothetical protein
MKKKHKVIYHSKVMQEIMEKMERDPWHVKLVRWYRLQDWLFRCLTRKYWDKTYEGFIFKRR